MYYVYILANNTRTTIYTGMTNDLIRRVYEHKHHADPDSFTAKYDVTRLVYFNFTPDVRSAIEREKQIKGWNRKRKKCVDIRDEPNMGRLIRFVTAVRGCGLPQPLRASQ